MARPRTDIEPRILHAARAAFLQSGVDGASLRTIARGAGTSVGMIYYYFRTKEDLFVGVVEEVYGKLLGEMAAILRAEGAVRDKLQKVFVRVGAASEEEIAVVRLIAREALSSTTRFERLFERFQRGHVALLLGALAEGVAAGEVDEAIPLPLAMFGALAMGALPQFAKRVAGDRLPFSVLPGGEALAAASTDVLFHGVAPRADRRAKAEPAGAATPRAPRRRPPVPGGSRS